MKVQAVVIEWVDSYAFLDKWNQRDDWEELKAESCKSVGWLLKETKHEVVIASCHSHEDCFGSITAIPKVAITKMIKLKVWNDRQLLR